MALIHRNIVSNMTGTAIVAGLTLVLTPVQVRVLGMEAFGVVGFVTTLQAAFAAFDFGLSSTLTREIAADPSSDKSSSNELIRSAMTVYWVVALILGLALAAGADWIGRSWFQASSLPKSDLADSLRVIALYLALRWPAALYVGLLSGFQRMDILNLVKVAITALRLLGGVAVILYWRSLSAFLWWTALSAVIEVAAYDFVSRRVHPTLPWPIGISAEAVRKVWRFSLSMNILGVLAIVMVQVDRLIVSKVLPLQELGHYSLAYTAASLITLLITSLGSAILPWLAAAHGRGEQRELARRYRRADQLMLFLVSMITFALLAYGQPLLGLWVGTDAAAHSHVALSLLAIGFWLSAVVANSYSVAVAHGAPGMYLRANLFAVFPYVGLVYLLTSRFGVAGAATSWICLNLFYAVTLVRHVHCAMLGISTFAWLTETVLPFAALGAGTFFGPHLLWQLLIGEPSSALASMLLIGFSATLYTVVFMLWIGRSQLADIRQLIRL